MSVSQTQWIFPCVAHSFPTCDSSTFPGMFTTRHDIAFYRRAFKSRVGSIKKIERRKRKAPHHSMECAITAICDRKLVRKRGDCTEVRYIKDQG